MNITNRLIVILLLASILPLAIVCCVALQGIDQIVALAVAANQPAGQAETMAVIQHVRNNVLGVAVIVGIVLTGLVVGLAYRWMSPLAALTAKAERKLGRPPAGRKLVEWDILADAFDTLQAERSAARLELDECTRALEAGVDLQMVELQRANATLTWRAMQLETSSQVGQQATSILDPDELLDQVVNLIQAQFGYDFVSVWLMSEGKDHILLRAGSGERGKVLREQGCRVSMDSMNVIVRACTSGIYSFADDRDTRAMCAAELLPDIRSELALPLRMGGRPFGALHIASGLEAFEPQDLLVLQMLADQMAIAIRNAQFYKVEKTRRQLAESLEQAGRELAMDLDLREVPRRILEQLAFVVPYERGSVLLQEEGMARLVAQCGFPEDERVQDLRMPIREGDVFHQVVSAARPLQLDNVLQTDSWLQLDWLPVNHSWLGVPLVYKDHVIGMISLTRPGVGAFNTEDATVVLAFATQAAIAIENATLYEEIARFNERLEQMVLDRTDELNKAYHNLEELDRTKSDFIVVAAHELRTPLSLIMGYAHLLEDVTEGISDAKVFLEGILSAQDRLHRIVEDMLDVSTIDSQMLDMNPQFVKLLDLSRRIQSEFKVTLQDRRLTLKVTKLDDLPPIQADPELLHKVFHHLLVNAIKYTPDGGSITVSGTLIAESGMEPMIQIAVCDTGVGIDPQHHDLIFEKFYQVGQAHYHSSSQTKFKGGGPGLGLAIVRGIVHAHKGRIWVESEGHDEERCPGSCFYVLLPVSGPTERPLGKIQLDAD
ncbi:MAG: GAF domain-containing protein [Thermoflexales bacterium]|nr:GAF domain-containing protein [Thermoflexales bacterium]